MSLWLLVSAWTHPARLHRSADLGHALRDVRAVVEDVHRQRDVDRAFGDRQVEDVALDLAGAVDPAEPVDADVERHHEPRRHPRPGRDHIRPRPAAHVEHDRVRRQGHQLVEEPGDPVAGRPAVGVDRGHIGEGIAGARLLQMGVAERVAAVHPHSVSQFRPRTLQDNCPQALGVLAALLAHRAERAAQIGYEATEHGAWVDWDALERTSAGSAAGHGTRAPRGAEQSPRSRPSDRAGRAGRWYQIRRSK